MPQARVSSENVARTLLQRGWRAAAESARPAIALAAVPDGSPEVIWVNRALTQLFGVDSSDLVGRPLADLIEVAADHGAALGWARVALEMVHGSPGQRDAAVRRIDGSEVRVQLDLTPLPGPGGNAPDGWLLGVHPLTDALQDAEASLREAEHRFTSLAASAPIGIFLSEAGMRLGYVNQQFVELCSSDPVQLLGTGWLDAVLPDDLPRLYAAGESVLGGTSTELAVRVLDREGEQRWLNLRLAPIITPARAAGFIGTADDVTERRQWEEQITYQAHHDSLTGLINRRRLIELLSGFMTGNRQADRQFAVLFLDLDGFKEVNDTFGHEAGDRVLIEVAQRMRRTAREGDLLARVSGDEFAIILRQVGSQADAEAAAARQLKGLVAPYRVERQEVRLSASVGVAMAADSHTPESLMRAADQAMYAAKVSGPGQFRVAGQDDGSAVPA